MMVTGDPELDNDYSSHSLSAYHVSGTSLINPHKLSMREVHRTDGKRTNIQRG